MYGELTWLAGAVARFRATSTGYTSPVEGGAVVAAETLVVALVREAPVSVVLVGYESVTGAAVVSLEVVRGVLTAVGLDVMDGVVGGSVRCTARTPSAARWRAQRCRRWTASPQR